MKTKTIKALLIIFALGISSLSVTEAASNTSNKAPAAKPGLLIIAHGAPWPQWNQPVLNLEKEVIKKLSSENQFSKVKVVFMEFAKPSVADGIKEFEDAGCSRIIAVPLLIAPSSHSHWDIPALLGLYSDEKMEEELKEEGAAIIRSKLPITLTSTLAESDVIQEVMLKNVKKLSKSPKNEAVILLAHGDHLTPCLWDKFMKKTVTYICGKTGITYGDWACVEMGQGYDKAAKIIAEAAEDHKKVIVVGAYLSMGIDKMHSRWEKQFTSTSGSMPGFENPLKSLDIELSKNGLLPDASVASWIANTAIAEVKRNCSELK